MAQLKILNRQFNGFLFSATIPDLMSSFACSSFHSSGLLSRRSMLRAGSLGMLGITLPKLLQASSQYTGPKPPVRAKSVIFLFQWGGPSHVDMFDMKPDAPDGYRSLYKQIPTSVPGMSVCEHLPKTAKIMHRVAQIRTVHHLRCEKRLICRRNRMFCVKPMVARHTARVVCWLDDLWNPV